MNDFSELEKELRKLRPAQPSPVLFERVGEALKDCRALRQTPNGSDGVFTAGAVWRPPILGGR